VSKAPLVVASTLSAVQVYRRGATVTRHATLAAADLAAGVPDAVELVGLPLSLYDTTVRVRVTTVEPSTSTVTAAGARIGIAVRAAGAPPLAPEQKEIQDLETTIRDREEALQLLDNELELLRSIPVPDRPESESGRAPPPAPLHMRIALESFADDAAQRRRSERRAIADEVRRLHEEHAQKLERVRAASSSAEVHQDELSKAVIVPLRAEGARPTRVVVEVSYVVPGARWAPAYQVKLARDGSTAAIQLRAHIAQRSGEDWKGVALKLSTASPLSFTELPELASIRIGRAQPPPRKKGFRPPPSGSDALFADFDRDRSRAATLVPPPRPWTMPNLDLPADSLVDAFDATAAAPPARRTLASQSSKKSRSAALRAQTTRAGVLAVDARDELEHSMAVDEFDDDADASLEAGCFDDEPSVEMSAPGPAVAAAPPRPRAPAAPPARAMARASGAPGGRGAGIDEVVGAMTFPLLRLPGADDGARGRLAPVDLRAAYTESARRAGRPIAFDVLSVVQAAEFAATRVADSLPAMAIDLSEFSSWFDFAYEADGTVEVTGDGSWHSVALGERECAANVRYIAVPREEANVYRVAAIQNPLTAPLLPGPAEVYVGGEYVLTTTLPMVSSRGEFKLGLGVEQSIKVARNTRFAETRTGEGVVAMVELVHDVDVDIVNHLPRAIDIEVRDRVPVPAPGAEVQVDERDVTPAWSLYEQDERDAPIEGGRRWQLSVAAGATQKLHARYVLKLFSNSEVAGGNRRER
jgi:hypothetical protein